MKKILLRSFYIFSLVLLSCNNVVNHFDAAQDEFATGLKGQVFISPISPVDREGASNKAPFEAILKFINSDNDTIKKLQTDENGIFQVELKPGTYSIKPEPIINTGRYPIGENKDVTIIKGEIKFIEIDFDSGIR
jgi:hypothetical protein